ncbi:MAG: hypothetical protein AAF242_12410 [Bacteroidota bacterium]
MNKVQKFFIKNSVKAFLKIQASRFQTKRLNTLGYRLNRFIAQTIIKSKGIGQAQSLEELGTNWQKGFPAKKQVPITHQDKNTVYGEIHTPCPLRGTGDVDACYKMMSYDRTIVEQGGGQFIVLESQAEKGKQKCKIAIRFQGEDTSDLIHAHKRYRQ